MSLVVFPFKSERIDVVAANLTVAARHERVDEVWAVAGDKGPDLQRVELVARDITALHSTPVRVFPQERLGRHRAGKGDGMNTALARSAERGFDRTHFYDADITNFDRGWIDGAESAADRGFGVVRHRFPRAPTDAMITWMLTRPGLAILFPGTVLPRLGQPLGGEMLLGLEAVEALAGDPFVRARSDWGVDTVITQATACLGLGIYEHYAPDGKRHALYGPLSDIREMALECLDAVASLRGRPGPGTARHESDPETDVPADLKSTVAYDVAATRALIASPPDGAERDVLERLGIDPEAPIEMGHEKWERVFPGLLEGFRLDDPAWGSAAFRLWSERVLHYTTNTAASGYERAIAHLEETIRRFEGAAGQD